MIIAIEGIDGSGKGTQLELLSENLRTHFSCVEKLAFPRYGQSRGANLVEEYLNGRFCNAMSFACVAAAAVS